MGHIGHGRYILWIDQAEWYVVCAACYYEHEDDQWTGFTRVCRQKDPIKRHQCWEKYKKQVYEQAANTMKCDFCGQEFEPFPEEDRWWRKR